MGAADADITVDIVACSGDKMAWQDNPADDKTIAVLMRAYDLGVDPSLSLLPPSLPRPDSLALIWHAASRGHASHV